jgi:N-acetylglucosaminyl-diphospho-decaprenol L-rhamnosyltransferase
MAALKIQDITIIIVTFNSAHCVSALASALNSVPNIIISDNASDDETIIRIEKEIPQALILKNDRNLGFGTANNRALALTKTRYALLLNPDCLPKSDFFAKLIKTATEFSDAAIIAPHLIRRNGDPEVSYRWPSTHWKSAGTKADGPCCVGFVCGAVMLLNMEIMQHVGFFDEEFFLYYEDDDLCQRVFSQKNQIILDPSLEVIHYSRGSVKGTNPLKYEFLRGFHHAQSKLLFEKKYFGEQRFRKLKQSTFILAILNLIPRLLIPYPRYLARLFGRIAGLISAN